MSIAPVLHLVHGMGTSLVAPAWPPITVQEAEGILARFLRNDQPIKLLWHSPRPFSAATLVRTSEGDLFLKRHHRTVRTPAMLLEEHAFIAHLSAAGIPVPEVMLATDGASAIAQGEWSYELHRKAPGSDLYRKRQSWTPYMSYGHAYEAGVALAKLHLAACDFDAPARALWPLVSSFTILPSPAPLAAAVSYVEARPAVVAFLANRPWRHELSHLFATMDNSLPERLSRQPSLWTHNDWHPSNLLWSADGTVRSVFDFGLSTRTCALHDLAIAIERTAIEWLRLGEWADDRLADPGTALAILSGYRSVRPLSRANIETLVRLLPLVHVEFALSEVNYGIAILAEPEEATLAWDMFLIGHARWFLSTAGRDFLAQLDSMMPA